MVPVSPVKLLPLHIFIFQLSKLYFPDDPCRRSSPCRNNGTCQSSGGNMSCECPEKFNGYLCEIFVSGK